MTRITWIVAAVWCVLLLIILCGCAAPRLTVEVGGIRDGVAYTARAEF